MLLPNKIVKTAFLLMLSVAVGCSNSQFKTDTNYQYVQIAECTIPVSKQFNLIEHKDKYHKFSYIDSNKLVDNMHLFGIRELKKDDYSKNIKRINDSGFRVLREYQKDNFKIIEFEMEGTRQKIINFYLLGENTMITIFNSSQKEIDKILSYCLKTKK